MNRYEELGVARSATTAEIRQAYRNVVRLVHPDRCQDEELRHLAELQMRRLNETADILLDPVRRQLYEAEIDRTALLPALPALQQAFAAGQREINLRMRGWYLLAGMVLASIFWFSRENDPPTRGIAHPELAFSSAALENGEGAPGEGALQDRLDELEGRLSALEHKPGAPSTAAPEAVGIAGEWVYHSTIAPALSLGGLAAEKRITLSIADQGGILRGTYLSGYEIAGGELSPTLTFRFDGKPDSGLLAWTGQGSVGSIQLRLLAPDALLASWWEHGANQHSDTTILHRASAFTAR